MPIDAQVAHAVLRRLGLELAGGADERDERQVDVERVLAPDVLAQLADRLEERQALDVADRAADLDEHDVDVLGDGADAVLDLVGDVRDDLDGAPEVVAAALLLDDRQVDLPGRPVVVPGRDLIGEALVVPEVEVGLGAVVGDVDLAVLVRAHRPGVDVDVGVELLQGDLVAVALEQRADRGGGEALAERRHDAAGDEDVLDGPGWPGFRIHDDVAHVSLRAPSLSCDELPDAFEVVRRVDADRVVVRFDGLDADAVLEGPQLLEGFGLLERRRREPCERQQALAPIDVQPDVAPRRRGGAVLAHVRDRRAREVERVAVAIDDHLRDVRVAVVRRVFDEAPQRAHAQRGFGGERRHGLVDHRRLDERLIALDVHDQIAVHAWRRPRRADPFRSGGWPTSSARRRRTRARRRRCARRRSPRSRRATERASLARR